MSDRIERSSDRFVFYHNDQELGHLEYVTRSSKEMDLTHTFVDPSGRGQGIGAKLCDAAFAYAREQGTR